MTEYHSISIYSGTNQKECKVGKYKISKKMVRKIERRTLINKMRRSMVRTFVKKQASIEAGDKQNAKVALLNAEKQLMRGAQKGAFNKKMASRKISRLTKKLINS